MRPIHRLACAVSLAVLAAACGSSTSNPDGGSNNTVKVDPTMSQSAISSAFSTAAADSTIEMAAGTYHLTNSLNLASKNNITVKGAARRRPSSTSAARPPGRTGVVQSIPSGQTVKVTFQDFSVQDTAGDGLKITGGTGVHVNRVNVSWPTRATHGGYGVYPVQSKQVLIENCTIDGASDTGIYVGQSDGIVVRTNTLTNNVAGIEIENSFNSDVTGNNSHDNTAGFLVFDLPGLPQVGGHNHRVYGNTFTNNNHPNFGDPSGTVALVPAGTGGVVMANTKVEIFNNTFSGNTALGVGIVSCFVAFPNSPQPASRPPRATWRCRARSTSMTTPSPATAPTRSPGTPTPTTRATSWRRCSRAASSLRAGRADTCPTSTTTESGRSAARATRTRSARRTTGAATSPTSTSTRSTSRPRC